MNLKKALSLLVILCTGLLPVLGQTYSSNQLLPAGHWAYEALFMLNNETKRTSFATNAPLSVAEFKMYLALVPYEKLSDSSKKIYDQLDSFLTEKDFKIDMGPVYFGFDLNLYPEFQAKSNKNIDWSFATDYTGHVNSVGGYKYFRNPADYRTTKADGISEDMEVLWAKEDPSNLPGIESDTHDYAASSFFLASSQSTPLITIPLYLGWSDYFIIQTDPCFTKSIWGMSHKDNFTNIVYNFNDMDFLWPRNAYGSAGYHSEKWGVNVNYGRQGIQIGKTLTGSVIYNSTFETEGYFQLNLYAPRLKYNLDVVEVSTDKYIYVHLIEARPLFDWVRLGVVEATLINKPFEMKFLNPIMIMHSYGSWADDDYYTKNEETVYGEAHVCQYMGIQVELTPFKNSRLYFLYAQNEIQPPNEQGSANGKSMPDSFGIQLGYEYTHSDKNNGWWKGTVEGVYTTPFCYLKQGADWSLYSQRFDMQSKTSSPICSWIGSPFGPDALGLSAKVEYTKLSKWNAGLAYLFLAHGTNSFGIFNNTITIDGETYYAYYPSVLRKMGLISDEDANDIARTYRLTGTVQFTNQVNLSGSYNFTDNFSLDAGLLYSFIFNNKNKSGNFAQGIEASFALKYTLFE